MTLVVARRSEGRIFMVGDTKFTPEISGGRDGQLHFIGGLKIVVLHPGVVIAFAHNTVSARQAIEGIHSRGVDLFDKAEVLNYFLNHHRRAAERGGNAMVEFIAAFELSNQVTELFLIKNGNVEWVDAGYIGNDLAYNRFLHLEHQLGTTLPAPFALDMAMRALDTVIQDPDPALQNVGGFTVGLRQSADEGFLYVHRVMAEGRPTPVHSGSAVPITFGGAPAGANEWILGSSPGDKYGVLTAFCQTGAFGVIYRPALNFTPRLIRKCTAADLVNESMQEVSQVTALLERL